MPAANEKLAEALTVLRDLQAAGKKAIRSADLTETVRTRLLANGYLEPVMKGLYIPTQPGAQGETTAWYTSFWDFCRGPQCPGVPNGCPVLDRNGPLRN